MRGGPVEPAPLPDKEKRPKFLGCGIGVTAVDRGPFLRMEVGHVPQRGGGAERFSVRERKRSSETARRPESNPQRRTSYGWGSDLKITGKGLPKMEPQARP